ncbi:hypothetical protein H6F86_21010 [Phormidium sp. FACHB-592]|uniref:Uncharacterized protein n=1 Tax=Stenomitos frigidus AS-A4 TaxID=2933935 RepID=A0ABV0KHA5_9CYAN|nr:hypothetical protein [Phormidium sp. FACHB-592]MBD2076315.1 hypothetical protein [Phormidium sp. FACHB-592]
MNHRFRAKPIYDGALLSGWQSISNPQQFSIEQFTLLLDIWASSLTKHGIYWGAIKKTDHRDGTVTIAAPGDAWLKAARIAKQEAQP